MNSTLLNLPQTIMELIKLSSKLTLVILLFLFFMTIIDKSLSVRTFGNPNQKHLHNHHKFHKISFLMQNVLNVTHPSQKPATTKVTSQIPFHKPLGFLPPNGGIPLPQSNPISGTSSQQLDVTNIGISFPARATLQELEFGSLTQIDEELFEGGKVYGSTSVVGRAQGVFVASSEDRADHMVAMTANFATSGFKDGYGLRFFGMFKKDAHESHIAVIGGIGKYDGANGYAVIKEVDARSNALSGDKNSTHKLLLFHVYLS